jgi:hypothetical protein
VAARSAQAVKGRQHVIPKDKQASDDLGRCRARRPRPHPGREVARDSQHGHPDLRYVLPSKMVFTDDWKGYDTARLSRSYLGHHRIRHDDRART